MFFPIGDVNIKHGTKPFLTYLIILANVAVFIHQLTLRPVMVESFFMEYGAVPWKLIQGLDWISLITSMFLHGGWMHLLGNMLFLWVFGDNIEATMGYIRFIFFYLLGGVVATATHVAFNPYSDIPCVGASGAIAACLGAYLVMFPRSQIKVLFIFLLVRFQVPAILFLGFWIVQQFMSGIGEFSATVEDTSVAYWAHIGGFVFGVIVGFFYKAKATRLSMNE